MPDGMVGEPVLVPVLANHRFDEAALLRYLTVALPGFAGPLVVRQFQGGQSNPTYHVQAGSGDYVLRRKPAGVLLPSAHAVDREYRILAALRDTDVPVPPVHLLCTDDAVIGTMFFVMDYTPGRVFPDRMLPGVDPADRRSMYLDMGRVLARLQTCANGTQHKVALRVDPAAGLGGKRGRIHAGSACTRARDAPPGPEPQGGALPIRPAGRPLCRRYGPGRPGWTGQSASAMCKR